MNAKIVQFVSYIHGYFEFEFLIPIISIPCIIIYKIFSLLNVFRLYKNIHMLLVKVQHIQKVMYKTSDIVFHECEHVFHECVHVVWTYWASESRDSVVIGKWFIWIIHSEYSNVKASRARLKQG